MATKDEVNQALLNAIENATKRGMSNTANVSSAQAAGTAAKQFAAAYALLNGNTASSITDSDGDGTDS